MAMMQTKLYLLLTILCVFIQLSTSSDQNSPPSDSTINLKSGVFTYGQNNNGYPSSFYYYPSSYPSPSSPWSGASSRSFYDGSKNENQYVVPPFMMPVSPNTNPMLSHSPVCYSIIDFEYPIISDLCGAVPQARYSLPNLFGHHERWQIAYLLSALASASKDPICISSLRILLCPMLFPSCRPRHIMPPVLPCQSFCQAVKAKCGIPTLNYLPCEMLPYSSDLCPIQPSYNSFMPSASYPSMSSSTGALPSSNYPTSPSLQSTQPSMPTSQGLSRALPSSSMLSPALTSSPTFFPSSTETRTAAQSVSPANHYNSASRTVNSVSSPMANYLSRANTHNYQQTQRYAAPMQLSMQTRPLAEARRSDNLYITTGTQMAHAKV